MRVFFFGLFIFASNLIWSNEIIVRDQIVIGVKVEDIVKDCGRFSEMENFLNKESWVESFLVGIRFYIVHLKKDWQIDAKREEIFSSLKNKAFVSFFNNVYKNDDCYIYTDGCFFISFKQEEARKSFLALYGTLFRWIEYKELKLFYMEPLLMDRRFIYDFAREVNNKIAGLEFIELDIYRKYLQK